MFEEDHKIEANFDNFFPIFFESKHGWLGSHQVDTYNQWL